MNLQALNKPLLLLIMISGIVISSCKKEKEDPEPEPTRKELLSHAWKVVDVRQGSETGTSVFNLPFPQVQCLKDNILTLVNDNSFTFDEGAIVCDPPMEAEGTWSLIESDTKLKLSSPGEDDIIITLVSVSEGKFSFEYKITEGIGEGTYIVIMQHKS
ncbi:MAG: hypothetical protein KF746_13915 [Chitinophagaceae bacterium]|nr:hypothetical protein [Chitinophagaceae bacterium]